MLAEVGVERAEHLPDADVREGSTGVVQTNARDGAGGNAEGERGTLGGVRGEDAALASEDRELQRSGRDAVVVRALVPVVEAEDAERVRHRERLYARARLCRRELVVGEVSKVETLPGLLLLAPVDIVLSPQAGGRLGGHRARTRSAEVGG